MNKDSFKISIKLAGIGEAQGLLKRHLAPITVGRLLRQLRDSSISGPAMCYAKGQICLQTKVAAGQEKAVREVDSGDLVYTPQTSSFCIFYEKNNPYSPVNKIGIITDGLELFEKLRTGVSITISLSE